MLLILIYMDGGWYCNVMGNNRNYCFDFCEVLMGRLFVLCVYEGIWYLLIYIYEVCLMLL